VAAIGRQETELAALADFARGMCEPAALDVMASLEKKPDDAGAWSALVYASLAMRDQEFTAQALRLLAAAKNQEGLVAARTIAKALLVDRKQIEPEVLAKFIDEGVAGEDLTVLLALASRRAGGETWEAFRAAAHELLGRRPLDGHVIVLVSRLAAGYLPIVAQR
jgi:hypothetical protein